MTIKGEVLDGDDVANGVDPANAVSRQNSEEEDLPIRERRDVVGGEEVLNAIADEAEGRADEEDEPEREVKGGEAGEPAEEFSGVGGEGEVVELELGDGEKGFELRGISREVRVGSIDGLKPYHSYQA